MLLNATNMFVLLSPVSDNINERSPADTNICCFPWEHIWPEICLTVKHRHVFESSITFILSRFKVRLKALCLCQITPTASPCWVHLPQRRSSWWASAPRAERNSGSLQRSSERPSRRSTRWSRYTSSVRNKTRRSIANTHILSRAVCDPAFLCFRGIGEAARHPAAHHPHQWRASGHTHRTRLSLRCWFCSRSMKCMKHNIHYSVTLWVSLNQWNMLFSKSKLLLCAQQDAFEGGNHLYLLQIRGLIPLSYFEARCEANAHWQLGNCCLTCWTVPNSTSKAHWFTI